MSDAAEEPDPNLFVLFGEPSSIQDVDIAVRVDKAIQRCSALRPMLAIAATLASACMAGLLVLAAARPLVEQMEHAEARKPSPVISASATLAIPSHL